MTRSSIVRRWLRIAGVTVLGSGAAFAHAAAGPAPPAVAPVPTTAVAVVGTVASNPSLSADGRYLVYSGLPATDDGRTSTVWLEDRASGGTFELTAPPDGVRTGNSVMPTISADGCRVAVVTEIAFDLFRDDDTGRRWDVYELTLPICGGQPGAWELVSAKAGDGFQASARDDVSPLTAPALSGSGTVVAYVHAFGPSADGVTGIDVVDLTVAAGDPGRSTAVGGSPPAAPATTFRYRGLREPSLSDDGSLVAFTSDAQSSSATREWGSGPTPGDYATSQVFVWNRADADPATNVVAVSSPAAAPANGTGWAPAISGDGDYIAFQSTATNLVAGAVLPACTPACAPQVYRFDRSDTNVTLVSRMAGPTGSTPIAADAGAFQPAITYDGAKIVFATRSANLFDVRSPTGGGPGEGDIVLADVAAGTLVRVSLQADGVTPAPSAQAHPAVSANARVIVFDTLAGSSFGVLDPGTAQHVVSVTRRPVLTMQDLDVGTVGVGYPGAEWFVTVLNDGPTSFLPATITSSNPDFGITGGTCKVGLPVRAGGSCNVSVILTPSVAGPQTGTLTVAEAGFGASTVFAALSGSGGEPALSIDPSGVNYGSVVVGQRSDPRTFSTTNVGFLAANVIGVSVSGANPADFVVTGTTCQGVVDIGQNCSLDVAFAPTASGARSATVTVSTDAGQYSSVLVGGQGNYSPTLLTSAARFFTGSRLAIGGGGFPPNTAVTVLWADGSRASYTATTNAQGNFLLGIIVGVSDRVGTRTLVAQTSSGETASVGVTVMSGTGDGAFGPGTPNWPGG
jgi:Tol biopolymer transport system component